MRVIIQELNWNLTGEIFKGKLYGTAKQQQNVIQGISLTLLLYILKKITEHWYSEKA